MDWKLELVIVPVSNVDRAKAFYLDKIGFNLDVDHRPGVGFRIVHMPSPGSGCSITIMKNTEAPGSLRGLHLVVSDIYQARAQLVARGVDASGIYHSESGNQIQGPDPNRGDYNSFVSFSHPGGKRLVGARSGTRRRSLKWTGSAGTRSQYVLASRFTRRVYSAQSEVSPYHCLGPQQV